MQRPMPQQVSWTICKSWFFPLPYIYIGPKYLTRLSRLSSLVARSFLYPLTQLAGHFVCVLFWTHGVFYYVVKAVLEFMIFLTQTSRDTHVSHLVIGFLSNLWNKWMHVSFKTLQSSHFLFIQFLPRKLALGITKIRKLTLLYYHANCRHHVAHTNHLFLRMLFWHVLNFIDVLIHVPTTVIRKQHGQISLRTLSPTAVPSLPPRGGQLFSFVESSHMGMGRACHAMAVQDNSLRSAPGTHVRKIGVVAHTCSPDPGKAETVDHWDLWASPCYFF